MTASLINTNPYLRDDEYLFKKEEIKNCHCSAGIKIGKGSGLIPYPHIHLKNPITRRAMFIKTIETSTAIEGVYIKLEEE